MMTMRTTKFRLATGLYTLALTIVPTQLALAGDSEAISEAAPSLTKAVMPEVEKPVTLPDTFAGHRDGAMLYTLGITTPNILGLIRLLYLVPILARLCA